MKLSSTCSLFLVPQRAWDTDECNSEGAQYTEVKSVLDEYMRSGRLSMKG
jgi:hypothetical protein